MKQKILYLCSIVLVSVFLVSFSFDDAAGWFKAGSKPKSYDMGIDKGAGQTGNDCASIKSIEKKIDGFGTLMQNFKADKYHGKKIRMTGYMRSKKVKSWAGFWLRVDGNEIKKSLAFDNMYKRAIKGTTDWNKYEIILEVSEKATKIAFGAMLHGTGQIWFDKIDFEVVDNSVPTTNMLDDMNKDEPQNLNFNK